MKTARAFFSAILAFAALCSPAAAQDADPAEAEVRKLVDGLHFESGTISIGDNLATLTLPDNLRYLDPKDANTVITDLWGNPPQNESTLGMIVPADSDLLSADGWAVVITYEEDGHIKDDDAASIDYDELLKQMQQGSEEFNKEREKQGYAPVKLVGWAAPPRYDSAGKKLYWAKELHFGDESINTLNYNIRILGRQGVLNLNAVAAMNELGEIEKVTPELLKLVSFNDGNRYADFNESTDKMATYGLAALVAGGVAAKAGFFKALWLGILAFKKLIIVGVVAVVGFVKKVFGKRSA